MTRKKLAQPKEAAAVPVRPTPPTPPPSQDVSHQALSLARAVDRVCRRPGRYQIVLSIPDPRQHAWQVEISLVEPLRRFNTRQSP